MRNKKFVQNGWKACRLPAVLSLVLLISGLFGQPANADDFYIEIDYMVERGPSDEILHTHEPQPDEISMITMMFLCQGHTLHIDISDEIPHIDVLQRDPQDNQNFFDYYGAGSFGAIKQAYQDHTGGGWHYCIFGHAYQNGEYQTTSSSGLSEMGGDDFIVTLGLWTNETGTPFERVATLAHEFGHNLGLGHSGTMDAEIVGHNPINVASTMSYNYQVLGVRANLICQGLTPARATLFKNLDYSHGTMCTLAENNLFEKFGTGMMAVDWDCDGTIEILPVAHDLQPVLDNSWCTATGGLQILSDYDEWSNLQDNTHILAKSQLDNMPTISCITFEETNRLRKSLSYCPQPPVEIEYCTDNRMRYVVPYDATMGYGTCDYPFTGISEAQFYSLPGDVMYLKGGVYNEPDSKIRLSKRMTITSTGAARIQPAGVSLEKTE